MMADSRNSGGGGASGPAGAGEGVYDDAILRQTRQRNRATSQARSGSDQPARLQYPLDPQGYQAEVVFEVVKPNSLIEDLNSLLEDGTAPAYADPDQDPYAEPDRVQARRKKSIRETEDRLNVQGVPQPPSGSVQTRGDIKAFEGKSGAYQEIRSARAQFESTGRQVRLYLPQAIQISDGVQVGPIDLGTAGAGTEASLNAGITNVPDIAMNAFAGTDIASIVDLIRNPNLQSTGARFAAQKAARKLDAGVAGAVARGTQVQVNPNTRSLFRAVNLREFSFTFKMIATSRAEAESIKAIIEFFRKELYPEEIELGVGDVRGSLAYRMPNLFNIRFLYKNNQQIATKLKPTYLRNFSATYNPSGMGMHDDGNFLETDITMSFVEDTTLSRQDINAGF